MLFVKEKDLLYEVGIKEMTYGLSPATSEEIIANWHELESMDFEVEEEA